jgi:hypothetical protein
MEIIGEEIEKLKQSQQQRQRNSISKLTAEDKADIKDARRAKKEYLQTGISHTVDELRAEFNLTSRWVVVIEKAGKSQTDADIASDND